MSRLAHLALPLSIAATFVANAEQQRPNILWIVTDDQRADALECWNKAVSGESESALGYVSSPRLNKLASEGVLFTRSYCNSPLSGPSRASMQTGKYPHHNGAFNFQLKHNEHDAANPMVPEIMREAGYQTSSFGKLGYYIYKYQKPMGYKYADSHYETMVSERTIEGSRIADFTYPRVAKGGNIAKIEEWLYPDGTSVKFNLYTKKNVKFESEENKAIREAFQKKHGMIIHDRNPAALSLAGESPMPTEKTEDGRIHEVFTEYLQNANKEYKSVVGKQLQGADSSKPQFINLGYHFPHTPVMPSKEFRDQFKDKKYKLPQFERWEVEKMGKQMQTWNKNFSFYDFTPEQQQRQIQDYYAFCAMGDELIGRSIDEFKHYCKQNNQPYVIVFACGDHGWHLGEQGAYFKQTGFLKSNETAIIVVSSDKKRFPAGKVVHDFTEYVDLAPTFYAAAGLNLKEERFDFLDGYDLAAVASGKAEPRAYVLGEVNINGNRAYMRSSDFAFSMRSRPANASIASMENLPNSNIKWALTCDPQMIEMGLYDMRVDPMERNNVAYDEEYKELAEWFRQKLGNIVLGDGRLEVVWNEKSVINISNFAKGADDKKLDIPAAIIPKVNIETKERAKKR